MQIKSMVRHYHAPNRIAKFRKKNLTAGKDPEKLDLSSIAGGNARWYSHSGHVFGSFM